MSFDDLNNSNYLMYALKYYDNPQCVCVDEFLQDLNHIKYLKRLFKRYNTNKDVDILKIRLVLNHLIVLYNVFGVEAATRILFLKIEPELWFILKTFLVFLNYLPDIVRGIDGKDISEASITIDVCILDELGKI